jgi:hypothetical protein
LNKIRSGGNSKLDERLNKPSISKDLPPEVVWRQVGFELKRIISQIEINILILSKCDSQLSQ